MPELLFGRLANIHQPVIEIIIIVVQTAFILKFLIIQQQGLLRAFVTCFIVIQEQVYLLVRLHLWQAFFKEGSRV